MIRFISISQGYTRFITDQHYNNLKRYLFKMTDINLPYTIKKSLKIGGITIVTILIIFVVVPFIFSGKIKNTLLNIANNQLNAHLEIEDLRLNFFSNFPDATLSLNDISITGINNFKGDTLAQAKSINATINLLKLLRGNYEIDHLRIDNMVINAKVLPRGEANWNIVKDDSTKARTIKEDNPFELQLNEISLKNCNIIYDDQISQNKIILYGWSGNISGDLKGDETTVKTNSTINEVSFLSKNIPYLNKLKLIANISFFADLKNMKFTLTKSELQLNEIKTNINGSIALFGKDGIEFDLGLTAPNAEFKNLLSILPRIYTKDFDHIKASGTVSFDGYIKGLMQGEKYPAFNIKLMVEDGMFQYLSLPQSVSNININILADNKGGSLDSTIIEISRLNFKVGNNPFKSNLLIKTPISDMSLKAHMDGTIDLGVIKDVYPLEENIELSGKIISDLNISTRMSYIEKDEYEKVETSGHFNIENITIKPDKQPAIQVKEAHINLDHQLINISSFHLNIGNNDLMITGRLENLLGYTIIDKTLKGQLDIKSTYLNIGDLTSAKTTTKPNNTASKPFVIPQNIDLIINPVLNKVVYEKTNLSNVSGSVIIKGGILTLKNAKANTLGGICKANGSYNM